MRWQDWRVCLLVASLVTGSAGAAGVAGDYVADGQSGVTLSLQEDPGGAISGRLTEEGASMPLSGRRKGASIAGTVGGGSEVLPFTATVDAERIVIDFGDAADGERLAFRRVPAATTVTGAAGAVPRHNVVINGRRLSDKEVQRAEQIYRIRIPDAEFWYDPVLGAWGGKGGPTMGFIAPGLVLGGALRADASGGGTNVFVNGRELHAYDLAALQQLVGLIMPGRYFITAEGLAGFEGGPPRWNLAAIAEQASGGGARTWQGRVTASSGFSDGTNTAVFLPNGGIVSTGPN